MSVSDCRLWDFNTAGTAYRHQRMEEWLRRDGNLGHTFVQDTAVSGPSMRMTIRSGLAEVVVTRVSDNATGRGLIPLPGTGLEDHLRSFLAG